MALHELWAEKEGFVFSSSKPACGYNGRACLLQESDVLPLPKEALLFYLPGRYLDASRKIAVAAVLPPGYVRRYHPYYQRRAQSAPLLPLRSYTAVGEKEGKIYAACLKLDDLENYGRVCSQEVLKKKVREKKKLFPKNSMVERLAQCALGYGCMTARNFFLEQGELALPLSFSCNAACWGCLSEAHMAVPAPQARMKLSFSVSEVVEVVLFHLEHDPHALLSFGQGCEGEPLLQAELIKKVMASVRQKTERGVFHINTNGSLPVQLQELACSGLESVRLSLNSAQPEYYERYYRPSHYTFQDVKESARRGQKLGLAVSLNFLFFPGVSDTKKEIEALRFFLEETGVTIIQVRDLNIDPAFYFKLMEPGEPGLGFEAWQESLGAVRLCSFNRSAWESFFPYFAKKASPLSSFGGFSRK